MIVRKYRLQRGWSQSQLAELSGLNIRTIQRIERGSQASLESLKSLAAVFEVDVTDLTEDTPMITENRLSQEELDAIEHVRDIKAFYSHLASYCLTMTGLLVLNLLTTDYLWVIWPAIGWGIGILSHAATVFEFVDLFGPDWEKKQIEKRLQKNKARSERRDS